MTKQIENMTREELLDALRIELNTVWGFTAVEELPDEYTAENAVLDMEALIADIDDPDDDFYKLLVAVKPADYAATVQAIIDDMVLESLGYDGPMTAPINTTFRSDFRIAERFGTAAIEDTYRRSFNCFRDDVQYMSALSIVLNERLWATYEGGRRDMALVYNKLWERCCKHCTTHFKGARLRYYYAVTD